MKALLWPYRLSLFAMIFFLMLMGLTQSALVVLSGPLLKLMIGGQDLLNLQNLMGTRLIPDVTLERKELVMWVPILLFFVGFTRVISSYLFQRSQAHFSILLARDLRERIFSRVLALEYLKIKEKSAAEWMSTIINDVYVLQSQISQLIMAFLKDGILCVFAIVAIVVLSPLLGLLLLVIAPFVLLGLGRYAKRIRAYAQMWQDHLRTMADNIYGLRERFWFFKALNAESAEKMIFSHINHHYYQSIRKSIFLRSVLSPLTEFLGLMMLLFVLYAVVLGWIRSDDVNVVQVFTAFALLIRPMKNIGEQLSHLGIVWGAVAEIQKLLTEAKSIDVPASCTPLPKSIHVEKCGFQYTLDHQKFQIEIEKFQWELGEYVALVGESGSGKSTFLKILAGLIRPDVWQANVDSWTLASHCAYVDQDSFLFKASIRENLCYGQSQPVMECDIVEVGVHLLGGMDLEKEFSSVHKNLSGGERQRIAIARALLLKRPICLLDESLAAVDTKQADYILTFCRRFSPGMSVVAITHRPEQLVHFDRVVRFSHGRLL